MAEEERDAELVLQLADVAAERRLRDVQPFRRPRHARLFGDGDERAKVPEIHGRRILYQIRMAVFRKMYWTAGERAQRRRGSMRGRARASGRVRDAIGEQIQRVKEGSCVE